MHRVLFIQDVLLNIFGYCARIPLAALARTCQIFKEPALDVLWEGLSDLSPLVRCLPEVCNFDGWCYSLSRPLNEAEWSILRGYTRRVRSIHIYPRARDDRILHFLASSTEPLFPNLRSLYWGDFETLPVVHTLVPSLISLSLCFQSMRGVSPQADLLDILGERCPDIRRFTTFSCRDDFFHTTISRQLYRWKSLRFVNCCEVILTMDFVLDLPSLPTLKQLSFTLSADLGNDIAHRGPAFIFSSLTDLNVTSTSLKSVTAFFSCIRLPKIMDLCVSDLEYTPRCGMQEYWNAVRKACSSKTLSCLAFSSLKYQAEDLTNLDEPSRQRLVLHDLLPYKDFGNLHKIYMNVGCPVNLSDADLLDLVSTSPQLEELSINDHWGWNMNREGGITLSGLVQLLRRCPSLCNASLVIDTRTFTRIPHGLDVSFAPRRPSGRTLCLNCLDTFFPPRPDPNIESVFRVLGLNVWSSLDLV